MDATILLYAFVRGGAAIYVARVEKMSIQPLPPDQQTVSVELRIEETLWGEPGKPMRRSEFTQPASEMTRLKFPHPMWGRVNLREGALVLLVTHELTEALADPLYVEGIVDSGDDVLNAIRALLTQERLERDAAACKTRYLSYLAGGSTVQKLFGAEALAKDTGLPGVDQDGQVAMAMATIFTSEESVYVRLSVGTWMWENIYPRTNSVGKVAVINATIKGVEDASEDIRRFSFDHLMTADPADLREAGVTKSPEAVRLLQEQLELETSPDVRDHIQRVIDALRP